jgi:hypothetical protein
MTSAAAITTVRFSVAVNSADSVSARRRSCLSPFQKLLSVQMLVTRRVAANASLVAIARTALVIIGHIRRENCPRNVTCHRARATSERSFSSANSCRSRSSGVSCVSAVMVDRRSPASYTNSACQNDSIQALEFLRALSP